MCHILKGLRGARGGGATRAPGAVDGRATARAGRARTEPDQNELPSLRAKRSNPCLRQSEFNRLASDLGEMDVFASLAMAEGAEAVSMFRPSKPGR